MSPFRWQPQCRTVRLVTAVAAMLLALGTVLTTAPVARAAPDLSVVAEALRKGPVYVDPSMRDQVSVADQDALAKRIKDSDKAVFVAVLPADMPTSQLFRNLRTRTGIAGVYAIRLGNRFDARADSRVMSGTSVGSAVTAVQGESATKQLDDFTDIAVRSARGSAPQSWGVGDSGSPTGLLIGAGVVLLVAGAGLFAVRRRRQHRRAEQEQAALEKLRVVVDEDITTFGEELDRLDFRPGEEGADDAMRSDYQRALDAYEQAKSVMASARRPQDVSGATQALEDGRFALATLEARRNGTALPERRPPCFFDPRHGPSVTDRAWAPTAGAVREVPVCAADLARLEDGRDPDIRTVETGTGRRPYWEAGPAYGPWAGGYFGGGILPGLLVGTLLGSTLSSPAYGADYGDGYGYGGGPDGFGGGDVSGSDFDPGDFGGGFGGGGNDGGGGDFGGGF
ncbi:LPXTG cell wall anchor domain-containing protein [Streptomyces sp. NBC_00344]|uniref:LPXTG cell wall anchor domain-containing protein n=1 Tax=Streptomyces sp. NBC_00344 TaxID=2975720 RepID=UPI002E1F07CD